jgi:hypothetical protein
MTVNEICRIENWNISQFLRMGFSISEATFATDNHIDWHEAERLIENGCTRETALRILA